MSRLVAPRPPAVQRDLDAKANTALNAAIAKNPNRPSADHKGEAIDGWPLSYAQAKPVVDAYVPKSEQRDLVDVGGGGIFGKVKGARATIQEFVQAYVLKGFAQPLHALRNKPEKVATRPADDKAARAWEQSNHKRYLAIAKNTRDMYKPLVKMRPTQPEVLAFLASEGLAANMGGSNEEKAAELARGPRIDVRSSYSGSQRDKVRARIHLFIVYTAANGEQWYLRGGPGEEGEDGLAGGYTTADIGRYAPGSLDWDPDASSVTVMSGPAAAGKLDAMVEAAHACDDAKVPYQMLTRRLKLEGENCNATAYTILTRAGVPAKKPSGVHPGWGKLLGRQTRNKIALPEKAADRAVAIAEKVDEDGGDLFKDRVGAELVRRIPGDTDVGVLAQDGAMAKVLVDGEIGWMSTRDFLRVRVPGRKAKLKGDSSRSIIPFDEHNVAHGDQVLEGGQAVEILDDTFEFGVPLHIGRKVKIRALSEGEEVEVYVSGRLLEEVEEEDSDEDSGDDDSGSDSDMDGLDEGSSDPTGRPAKVVAGRSGVDIIHPDKMMSLGNFFDPGQAIEVLDADFEIGNAGQDDQLVRVRGAIFGQMVEGRIMGRSIVPPDPVADEALGGEAGGGAQQGQGGERPAEIEGATHVLRGRGGADGVEAFGLMGQDEDPIPDGTKVVVLEADYQIWERVQVRVLRNGKVTAVRVYGEALEKL